jgi:hypothetical protein
MKVWITKYAMTEGILAVDAEHSQINAGTVKYRRSPKHLQEYAHSGEWHTSQSDAIDRAEDMREAKIKSLRKQIAKLEAMKFEVKE